MSKNWVIFLIYEMLFTSPTLSKGNPFIVGRRPSQEGGHPHWLWEHVCITSEEEFSVNTNVFTSLPYYVNPGCFLFCEDTGNQNCLAVSAGCTYYCLLFVLLAVFPSQTWKGAQFIVGRRLSQAGGHPHWLWEHVCITSEEVFSVNTNFFTSCPYYINPGYFLCWTDTGHQYWL